MTTAVVDPHYLFGIGQVDFKSLISKLYDYQQLIDICCKDNN